MKFKSFVSKRESNKLNNDYSFQYQYQVNRFYIDNKVKDLRERFAQIDTCIKLFKKIKFKKITK